ncbi:hypothetical protein [Thermoanaerobacterium thermosaccharolyticum]|uniref:hypothetical protein n=1 Tax=Thermoanaerobacterium thermosaccharolyticum TaxID=1517 RepID=UPI003DA953EF
MILMWVLGQNKNFIEQITEVWIEPKDTSSETTWSIMANNYVTLGKYADEERAKEIIQNLYNAIKTGNKTFQMPEK